MADNSIAMTSAIAKRNDAVSHEQAATRGEESTLTPESCQAEKETAQQAQSSHQVTEGQRENLLYTEDLGFLPVLKDPRYMFYRHHKNQKFDIKNEDVFRATRKLIYWNIWNCYKF